MEVIPPRARRSPRAPRSLALLIACGIASATCGFAVAVLASPTFKPRDSEKHQSAIFSGLAAAIPETCTPTSYSIAVSRSMLRTWLALISRPTMRGGIDSFSDEGLNISWALGTMHDAMGLAAGDQVALIQNIALRSEAHAALLATKLRLEEPNTVAVGVLRDGCPLWLNWRIP